MAYDVGEASLRIVPSFKGVIEQIDAQSVAWGKSAGEAFTKTWNDTVKGGLGLPGAPTFGRKGVEAGGAFADSFKARVTAALRDLPKPKVGVDATYLDAQLADIRMRMAALADVRIGVDLDEGAALAELDSLHARLSALARESPSIQVRVDAAKAIAELEAVWALAKSVDRETVEAAADTSNGFNLAEHSVSTLTAALVALAPAAVPIGAALVATFVPAAAVLGSVAGGLGVVALGAKGVAAEVKDQVAPAFAHLQQVAANGLLPGVEASIKNLLTIAPELSSFVGSLAHEMGDLAAEATSALTGPYWRQFYQFVKAEAGPTLDELGGVVGNLAHGFAGLIEAFAPVTHEIGAGLERLTADFARFGDHAGTSSGFQSFLIYVEHEGPVVVHTIGDLAQAIGHVLVAIAPLGGVVLEVIDGFSRFISAIPSGVLLGFATAAAAAVVQLKLIIPALALFDAELAANPIVLAGIAVTAFGLALYEVYQHSEQARAAIDSLSAGLVGDFFHGVTIASRAVENLSERLGGLRNAAKLFSLGVPGLASLGRGLGGGSGESFTGGFSKQAVSSVVAAFADVKQSGSVAFTVVKNAEKAATDALQQYSDELHALTDPLFAFGLAQRDLKDRQKAYNDAVAQYGKNSGRAKSALQDLAQAAVRSESAAADLNKAVVNGDVSMSKARKTLRGLVADHEISRSEANKLIAAWGAYINQSSKLGPGVRKGTVAAEHAVQHLASAVQTSLGGVASSVVSDGLNFALGFAQGISSGENPVLAAVHALVSAALAAVPKTQKSKSPARATMPYGRHFGLGFAVGIDQSTTAVADAATRMVHVALSAAALVNRAISHAIAPDITDPHRLASIFGRDRQAAISSREDAQRAHANYVALKDNAKALDDVAKAADKAATSAKRKADAMKAGTDAEKAAKNQAESHAKTLQKLANEADRTARHADNAAERGQRAWQKAADAAQNAAQKSADAAEALVSNLTDSLDEMQQQISDFTGEVRQGLTGDFSLSSIWSDLVGTQTQAASDLASALSTYQSAQDAVTAAGADATADQLKQLTDAQDALTKARAAADQANAAVSVTGVQDSLNTVLANAQHFAGDLQTLVGEGATQALISQLVGMGPTAGAALADQLIAAGPDSVAKLSATLDQIASYTAGAADAMAQTFYGGGVSAMEQFVEGLEKSFPVLQQALDPILAQLQAMFAGAAGLPTGGPTFKNPIRIGPSLGALPNGSLTGSGGGTIAAFQGDLYLDSGEFLGRVRGEANQVLDDRVAGATLAATQGTPGGALGALSSNHATAVSR